MKMKAKEIYNIIREKPYKGGEKMIIDYAKQKVKERDGIIKKLGFMIKNGLGWDDITYPNEL